MSAIGAGLFSIGTPKDSIIRYEVALKADNFLLVAHGTAAEIERAQKVITTTRPAEMGIHGSENLATAGTV